MPSNALEPATPMPIPGPTTPTAAIPEPIKDAALIKVFGSTAAAPACAMSVWSTVDLLLCRDRLGDCPVLPLEAYRRTQLCEPSGASRKHRELYQACWRTIGAFRAFFARDHETAG